MAKLTKRDIVVAISNQTGMVQHEVFDVVQRTLDKITDSLANNIAVELRNFGVFQPRLTKPRVGRNPNQPGSSFVIPPRATVKFKAGKIMRQRVESFTRIERSLSDKQILAHRPAMAINKALIGFRSGVRCWLGLDQILDRLFQALEIDRFREMLGKACCPGFGYVMFGSKASERNSRQTFAVAKLPH